MDINPFYKHIGMTIRSAREALGMTQGELANVVGLSRTSLTNIESGRQRILVDQLAELADALDIPAHSLIPERNFLTVREDNSEQFASLPTVTNFLNSVRSPEKVT